MSTVLRPVGPQPPRVYWVRRLLLLGLVLLVVLLVVWLISSRGTDADAAADTEGDETSAGEDASAGGGPIACEPGDLTVTLSSDARTYGADSRPVMTLSVANASEAPCTVDVGSGNRAVTITSGSDRIWSSVDCAGDEGEALRLLDAGAAETVGVDWKRERSDPDCTAGLPEPRPGTYTAVASVLGVESETLVFELG
jgi:hypothetical protein